MTVILCLNINEALLLLAARISTLAQLRSINGSSLYYCHKLADFLE